MLMAREYPLSAKNQGVYYALQEHERQVSNSVGDKSQRSSDISCFCMYTSYLCKHWGIVLAVEAVFPMMLGDHLVRNPIHPLTDYLNMHTLPPIIPLLLALLFHTARGRVLIHVSSNLWLYWL